MVGLCTAIFVLLPLMSRQELCTSTDVSLVKVVRSVRSCNFPLPLCSSGGGDLFQPFTMWCLTTARDFCMHVIFYDYTCVVKLVLDQRKHVPCFMVLADPSVSALCTTTQKNRGREWRSWFLLGSTYGNRKSLWQCFAQLLLCKITKFVLNFFFFVQIVDKCL